MIAEPSLAEFRVELVAAARREIARRHRRRLLVVVAAIAVSFVMVGAAVAAKVWLTGAAAPRAVVSDFGSYAPGLGFHPNPGEAVLVAHDGAVPVPDADMPQLRDSVLAWKQRQRDSLGPLAGPEPEESPEEEDPGVAAPAPQTP